MNRKKFTYLSFIILFLTIGSILLHSYILNLVDDKLIEEEIKLENSSKLQTIQ